MRPRRPKQYCLQLYIYIYIYGRKKHINYKFIPTSLVSWSPTHQSPDEWATTKQACRDELVVYVFFFFRIYFALLLCIEHCFTKIKFHTLYIYIYIYIAWISVMVDQTINSQQKDPKGCTLSPQLVFKVDLTLLLQDGFISTDIYSKPTDSHLYLPYNSSHPDHCKKAIPYGVALRIRRNCSTTPLLWSAVVNTKATSKQQNYNGNLVDKQFEKAMQLERSDVLKPKTKTKKKPFPLVVDYNPRLPNISLIIKNIFTCSNPTK